MIGGQHPPFWSPEFHGEPRPEMGKSCHPRQRRRRRSGSAALALRLTQTRTHLYSDSLALIHTHTQTHSQTTTTRLSALAPRLKLPLVHIIAYTAHMASAPNSPDDDSEPELDDADFDDLADISRERRKRLRVVGPPACSNAVCQNKMIPKKMIVICMSLLNMFGAPDRVDSVELFAGCQSVSNAMKGTGQLKTLTSPPQDALWAGSPGPPWT